MTLLHQWAFDHATVGAVMMEIRNLVGKSTRRVDGVVAALRVPLAGDRTVE